MIQLKSEQADWLIAKIDKIWNSYLRSKKDYERAIATDICGPIVRAIHECTESEHEYHREAGCQMQMDEESKIKKPEIVKDHAI
jgi:hypothetical protein